MTPIYMAFRGSTRNIFQQLDTLLASRESGQVSQEQLLQKLSALMMSLPRLSVSSVENDDGDAFEAVLDADGRVRVQTLETRNVPSLSAAGARRLRDFLETIYV